MAAKGKVEKVYSLTPFGKEMAKIVYDFEQRIRIDALEDLRVLIISRIETRAAEFFQVKKKELPLKEAIAQHNGAIAAYHEMIDLIAAAKRPAKVPSEIQTDAVIGGVRFTSRRRKSKISAKVQSMMDASGIKDPKAAQEYYNPLRNKDRGDWIK